MSKTLIILKDQGRSLSFTEDMLDEWFRSLSAEDKAGIFWFEHEARPETSAAFDEAYRSAGTALGRSDHGLAQRAALHRHHEVLRLELPAHAGMLSGGPVEQEGEVIQ